MKVKQAIGAILMALLFVLPFAGCEEEKKQPPKPEKEHTLSFLKADGALVKNAEGEEVILRGVNVGGLGVIEQWMTGFTGSRDHLTTTQVFAERFGESAAQALWNLYQSYWWSEEDFANCAEMGINVIRLPFTYMNVDFGATFDLKRAGQYDFTFLDDFVNTAEEYGIYTILDMHGAYGSQNGQDHSGQTFGSAAEVDFYSNEQKISLTEKLWGAIAEHFKDNPAVAGYDLLNEPGEKAGETGKPHWDALDRFYKAIRAAGDEHLVIFESCWAGSNLPQPSEYSWENCMYSFHHYTGCSGQDQTEAHLASFSARLREVERQEFGVPLYMGEFTCYTSEEQWVSTLALLNERGWHWTSWTYKIWGNSGWGIYNINTQGQEKINAHTDDLDAIQEKMRAVETDNAFRYFFNSGRTLFDIIQAYARPASGNGDGYED